MDEAKTFEKTIYDWFDDFHRNPEVSWKEFNTTKKIAKILQDLNVKYKLFDDITGVIAEIGEGDEVIAVRADIDALYQEVNGKMQANHSCGHDANISMVLGALLLLKELPLKKRIRFIFQPAEETGGGSLEMIKRGAIDDVTYLFGIHLRPIDELPFEKVSPAIYHGAVAFLSGTIEGIDAHGARPYQGKNAIDVLVQIHQMLKNIYLNPFEPYSAKLTKFVADGGSINIIPGHGEFSIDVRAQKNTTLKQVQQKINEGIQSISNMFNIKINSEWVDEAPGAEVSIEASKIVEQSIIQVLGKEYLAAPIITPGSDDFHYYAKERPNIKAVMIGIGADLSPGLHHPLMTFKKEALIIGARVLAATLKNASVMQSKG